MILWCFDILSKLNRSLYSYEWYLNLFRKKNIVFIFFSMHPTHIYSRHIGKNETWSFFSKPGRLQKLGVFIYQKKNNDMMGFRKKKKKYWKLCKCRSQKKIICHIISTSGDALGDFVNFPKNTVHIRKKTYTLGILFYIHKICDFSISSITSEKKFFFWWFQNKINYYTHIHILKNGFGVYVGFH